MGICKRNLFYCTACTNNMYVTWHTVAWVADTYHFSRSGSGSIGTLDLDTNPRYDQTLGN